MLCASLFERFPRWGDASLRGGGGVLLLLDVSWDVGGDGRSRGTGQDGVMDLSEGNGTYQRERESILKELHHPSPKH